MLLRSSSTPIAQTLFPESPNRDLETKHHFNNHNHHQGGYRRHQNHLNLSSFSCNAPPILQSASGLFKCHSSSTSPRCRTIQRAQSDGNLKGLVSGSFDFEGCKYNLNTFTRSLHNQRKTMLHTAPSFSIFTAQDGVEEENGDSGLNSANDDVNADGSLERTVTIGDSIGSGDFSFGKRGMALIEENDEEAVLTPINNMGIEEEEEEAQPSSPMYLASGLGIDGYGGSACTTPNFHEDSNTEDYYKRMLGEDPINTLFLRNFAQLLESKGDLDGAEEYYFRATLADPKDGEILLSYAKLVWKLHHDQDRALHCFERAAQASPDDSHVLAAFASFLWEIDEDTDEDVSEHNQVEKDSSVAGVGKNPIGFDVAASRESFANSEIIASNTGKGVCMEDHYRRMVKENPSNPLFLRNYAQFLYESKGDLKGAEEYYSRAILADPGDGEIMSLYATLVWELHHDQDKASFYFERSVQAAAPEDSHVLAAYASFLWETEEDDEAEQYAGQYGFETPLQLEAMTSASS